MEFNTTQLKGFIPYFGTFFILIGSLNLNLYYSYFNIDISHYLEFTEVLVLFFYDAAKVILFILAITLFNFLVDTTAEMNALYEETESILSIENPLQRFKAFAFHYRLIIGLECFLLLLLSYAYFFTNYAFSQLAPTILGLISMTIFLYLLLEFKRKYNIKYGKPMNNTVHNLTIFFFLFTLFSFGITYFKIRDVKDNCSTFVCFNFEGSDISTNQNFVYIGQTKNYFFLYDKLNEETTVYPRTSISEMNIKQID